MVVTMWITISRDVMPCSVVEIQLLLEHMLPAYREDDNSTSIRKVGEFLPDYKVSHPRRQLSPLLLTLSGTNYFYFMMPEILILNCEFLEINCVKTNEFISSIILLRNACNQKYTKKDKVLLVHTVKT